MGSEMCIRDSSLAAFNGSQPLGTAQVVHRYGTLARGPSLASSFFLRFSCPGLRAASLALSVLATALVLLIRLVAQLVLARLVLVVLALVLVLLTAPPTAGLLVLARLVGSAPRGSQMSPCAFIRGVERDVKVGRRCAMLLGRVAVKLSQVATVEPA